MVRNRGSECRHPQLITELRGKLAAGAAFRKRGDSSPLSPKQLPEIEVKHREKQKETMLVETQRHRKKMEVVNMVEMEANTYYAPTTSPYY